MFDLKRTGRKRDIGVTVSRGRVAVQAPNHFSDDQVAKHLATKSDWVLAALAEQATQEREYVSGESFSIWVADTGSSAPPAESLRTPN